ncbi:MAG: hypothetical protein ABSB15_05075 [Bryobacteraceae bacterium]|jgi:hypothetical protein
MTPISWWLVGSLSRALEPDERNAVLGDFAESGRTGGAALRDLSGLILRRQAALWKGWRPWLTLIGLVGPTGLLLSVYSHSLIGSYDLRLWVMRNYSDMDPAVLTQLGLTLQRDIALLLSRSLLLVLWAWCNGFILAYLARRTVGIDGAVFCFVLLYLGRPPVSRHYNYDVNGGFFSLAFYSAALPLIFLLALVILPSVWGMYLGTRQDAGRVVRGSLWAAAIVAAIAPRIWFVWPNRASWQMQLLSLAVCWPIGYLLAAGLVRRTHRKGANNP